MKRKFKLADGTVGMLDTDTGDFEPEGSASKEGGEEPQFPMKGYENVPPEKGLVHEDPIGDMLVGNAVAGGLPKLLEAAGGAVGRAGATATTRLATKTAEEEAARLAAKAAPKIPESPIRKLGNVVEKAVDLHHPLKPVVNGAAHLLEGPIDRRLASPALNRAAGAMTAWAPASKPAAWLAYLMGHGLSDEDTTPNGGQ